MENKMKTFKKFLESYEPVNEAEYNKEWWDSKSDSFKKRYIERHPNSIYAKNGLGSGGTNRTRNSASNKKTVQTQSKPSKEAPKKNGSQQRYWVGQTVDPDDDDLPDSVLVDDDGIVTGFTSKAAFKKYGKEPTDSDKKEDKENLNRIDKFWDLDDYLTKNKKKISPKDFEKMINQYDDNEKLKDLVQYHYMSTGNASPQAIKQYYKPQFDKLEQALNTEKSPKFSLLEQIPFDELLKNKNAPKEIVDKAFDLVERIANKKIFKDSIGKRGLETYEIEKYLSDKRFDKDKALDILRNPMNRDSVFGEKANGGYTDSIIWPVMFHPNVNEKDILDVIDKLPSDSTWVGDEGDGYARAYKMEAKDLGKPVNSKILAALKKKGPSFRK